MKKTLFSLTASLLTATSLIAAHQAVVFDFGGVLTGEPNREAVVNFIDDRPENIEAAKAAGLDAILFQSEQQLRGELSKIGII